MHALAAPGSEQKRKACINFTQMNLFSKWYCNGNTLPHYWNLWTSYVIILVQCNFFMIFQSIVLPVLCHNKFLKICMQRDWFMYHLRPNYKNRLEFPFKLFHHSTVTLLTFIIHNRIIFCDENTNICYINWKLKILKGNSGTGLT